MYIVRFMDYGDVKAADILPPGYQCLARLRFNTDQEDEQGVGWRELKKSTFYRNLHSTSKSVTM